jgi:hypothetical protein
MTTIGDAVISNTILTISVEIALTSFRLLSNGVQKHNPSPNLRAKPSEGFPPCLQIHCLMFLETICFNLGSSSKVKTIQLNALEQLAYLGHRGMGAWEYEPAITMEAPSSFRIAEMT